ncbi:MAG: 6-phospho-beta-glucosidase, partial [Clostridia bacterium]|nr:6-phospho-beta-glucosidase [Clostridia bacterium]
ALSLGILGQETTGAAGFSFAMRSIPALKEYCELIKKYAKPCVKVFNFTNPAGLVSQALRDMGYDFTYGVCDAPSGMLHSFAALLGVEPEKMKGEIYGCNHLSYFKSITANGEDVTKQLIENDAAYADTDMRYFEKDLLREYNMIFNEYLYYYYYREQAVENIIKADKTRGEQICQINKLMTAELSGMDIENDFPSCLAVFEKYYGMRENSYMASETGIVRQNKWKFDPFSRDAGGYAGVALKYMDIIKSGKKDSMILCVPNGNAVDGLESTDVVEITCDILPDGRAVPHRFEAVNTDSLELIRRVKLYERQAAKAIVNRDRALAVSAFTLHPLVGSYSLAVKLADEYISLNREYCGEWR